MGVYFLFTYSHHGRMDTNNNKWLADNREKITLAQEIKQIDTVTNQIILTQGILQEEQTLMQEVTTDLVALILNEKEALRMFESNGVDFATMTLENMTVASISETIDAIKSRPYVERVAMNRLENQHTSEENYLVELVITIDEATVKEVLQ